MPASADVATPLARSARVPGGLGFWLAWPIGLLPRIALPAVGGWLGWFVGSVLGVRRDHVERSMKLAGIVRSRAPLLANAMYRSLGRSLVEILWLAANPRMKASRMASLDEYSRAVFGAVREGGRGAVLATAHAGNWELAAAALAERHPLTVVAKRMSVGWIDRFCRGARIGRGVKLAPDEGTLQEARAALARGEILAMLIDQVPNRKSHAITVDFLRARADVDRSPASLAAAVGAPLVVAVSRRLGDGGHVLEVLAVLEPPARDRRAWVVEATRIATRVFERWVEAHPEEWLWMHRRWKAAPVMMVARAPLDRPRPKPPCDIRGAA